MSGLDPAQLDQILEQKAVHVKRHLPADWAGKKETEEIEEEEQIEEEEEEDIPPPPPPVEDEEDFIIALDQLQESRKGARYTKSFSR